MVVPNSAVTVVAVATFWAVIAVEMVGADQCTPCCIPSHSVGQGPKGHLQGRLMARIEVAVLTVSGVGLEV